MKDARSAGAANDFVPSQVSYLKPSSLLKQSVGLQVCLAAEECGHLNFDSRTDMWWNGDAFHCGTGPRGIVHFHDIFLKVLLQRWLHHLLSQHA